MTAGTLDRHRGLADGYDITALGFNYRIDEPRAALLLSRFARLAGEIDRRRHLTRALSRAPGRDRGDLGPLRSTSRSSTHRPTR